MTYTAKQIETAKINYNDMMVIRTVESYNPENIGWSEAEQRCAFHNNIVTSIIGGNKELEKQWEVEAQVLLVKNLNRNFIGIEKNDKYFEIAENRINGTEFKPNSFEKTEERGLFLF